MTVARPVAKKIVEHSEYTGRELVTVGNLVTTDTTVLTNVISVDPIYAYADVDERTVIAYQEMINEGKVKDVRNLTIQVGVPALLTSTTSISSDAPTR